VRRIRATERIHVTAAESSSPRGNPGAATPVPACVTRLRRRQGALEGAIARLEQGVSFEVRDHTGSPLVNSEIKTQGAITGLDVGFSTEIKLLQPCSAVEATLMHFARPATLEATSIVSVTREVERVRLSRADLPMVGQPCRT
jgi:hypothetical protein